MKISACMIVRNEENNIVKCIESLKGIVDEIIVVDTGSEDDTVRLAKEQGAFVYEQEWQNDFSRAKNYALKQAEGDWIIFLDADEYFREDCRSLIRTVIEKAHPLRTTNGIICDLINIDKDTGRVISNSEILRIFRNHKRIRYVNKIHEELRADGKAVTCVKARGTIAIMHTGYSDSILKEKAKRNIEVLLKNQEEPKILYYLTTTYYLLEDYEKTYEYAELAVKDKTVTGHGGLAYKVYLLRAAAYMRLERSNKEELGRLIQEASEACGDHPEIAALEASLHFERGEYRMALEKYRYALKCNETPERYEQNDFPNTLAGVYCDMGNLLSLAGQDADALEYYTKALQIERYHAAAFKGLLELCRPLPEDQTIVFINSLYGLYHLSGGAEYPECVEEMRFLVSLIGVCGQPKLVLYYAAKWKNLYKKEDDILIYAFLAQGNYATALQVAAVYLRINSSRYEALVVALVIMGNLFHEAETLRNLIGPAYQKLIRCYREKMQYVADYAIYLSVLTLLVRHAPQDIVDDYLELAAVNNDGTKIVSLEIVNSFDIGEVFIREGQFQKATGFYRDFFESQDLAQKALAAFKVGLCFFRLKQYEESLIWLDKAEASGYNEPELKDYRAWSVEAIASATNGK